MQASFLVVLGGKWNDSEDRVEGDVFVRLSIFATVIAVLLGITCGVVGYVVHYADAFAYFNDDPRSCMNCHVMTEHYTSWTKSGHHAAATCNDCHTPHDFVGKYTSKALNGYHHSKAFTLQDFHEPIMITKRNADALQENCVACHAELVSGVVHGSKSKESDVRCVSCHRDVGHGPVR